MSGARRIFRLAWMAAFMWLALSVSTSAQKFTCTIPIPTLKDQMIRESTARYQGSCPCPYFRDRAGRSCGRRSAWSRPGGASPLCYPEDITADMVREFCDVLRLRGATN